MVGDLLEFVSSKIDPLERLDYAWDEWEADSYITPMDSDLISALGPVSRNALIGFGAAISIWIYRALEGHGKSQSFISFLEVAAASSLEDPILLDFEVDIDEWRGPKNGPYAVSMTSMIRLIHDLANLHIQADQIHFLKALFQHIRPETSVFEAWFDGCVDWLTREQVTEDLKPKDYEPGFFDILDFVGYPLPLAAFIPGTKMTKAECASAFEAQRFAISANNRYLSGRA